MILYRLGGSKYGASLSGSGRAQRWNPTGVPLLYTSEHRSLAFCEVLAHFNELSIFPSNYEFITYEVDSAVVPWEPVIADLPAGWNDPKPYLPRVQAYGQAFHDSDHLLLRVPSVVIPQEWNYLINPRHAQGKVRIVDREQFDVDKRFDIFIP